MRPKVVKKIPKLSKKERKKKAFAVNVFLITYHFRKQDFTVLRKLNSTSAINQPKIMSC